jgi:hypothetical protein
MMDIFRDPLWQFVGVVVAAIGLFIPIIRFVFKRPQRAIYYEVLSHEPLLTVKEEDAGRVQISFDGKPVIRPYVMILRLSNPGRTALEQKEFVTPISVKFKKGVKILTADLVRSRPKDLKINLEIVEDELRLHPSLLNQGDTLFVKLILDGFGSELTVTGRVVGVEKIQTPFIARAIDFFMISGAVCLALGMATNVLGFHSIGMPLIYIFMGCSGIGWLLLYPRILRENWERRHLNNNRQ